MSFVVGNYRAIELIGAGGSAKVWRGVAVGTGVQVALKVFRPQELTLARREAALAAAVDHPHVVKVLDVVGDTERAALITEYAAGGDLADLLARRGRLSAGETLTVLLPVAAALATAHERQIVHGDVSAQNILFDTAGRPLLADLGAGRAAAEGGRPVALTPSDAAPELARGATPTAATDMFSLGSLALACLTGRHAWPADDLRDVAIQATAGQWPDPDDADAPPPLLSAVRGLLQRDADRRPGAASLVMDLRAAGRPEPVDLRLGTTPTQTGSRHGLAARPLEEIAASSPLAVGADRRRGQETGTNNEQLDLARIGRARAVTRVRPDAVATSVSDPPSRPRRVWAIGLPRGDGQARQLPPGPVGRRPGRRPRAVRIALLVLVTLTVAGLAGAGGLWWANWDRTDPVALPQISAAPAAPAPSTRPALSMQPTSPVAQSSSRPSTRSTSPTAGTASTAPTVSTAGTAPAGPTPPRTTNPARPAASTPPEDFTATVRALDEARARALVARDAALLDAAYTSDSAARSADAKMIASLISGGLRLSGAGHLVRTTKVIGSAPLRIEVDDSLPSYSLLNADGAVVGNTAARAAAARVMVLVKTPAGFRISAVQ